MKEIFRNNYISLTVFKGIMVGIAYHDQTLIISVGPMAIDINMYMFKKRARIKKPSSF
jgi:hypothetical protein